ncbi:Stress-activated map kinase-interacting protein 1 [Smittium mucronatum]|uniref:Stress-activated map kinase-interacting protein 1 n=1 Tax=Smittium mucronatum TaxID=133383 RepID=A0A1R0GNL2_9FUNG|nr:Stress-activated map kinase-interacting protein 1 [Smittium mucronatum]
MSIISDKNFLIYQLRKLFLENNDGSCENVITKADLKEFQRTHSIPYVSILKSANLKESKNTLDVDETPISEDFRSPFEQPNFAFESQFKAYDHPRHKKDSPNTLARKRSAEYRGNFQVNVSAMSQIKQRNGQNVLTPKRMGPIPAISVLDSNNNIPKTNPEIIKHFDLLNLNNIKNNIGSEKGNINSKNDTSAIKPPRNVKMATNPTKLIKKTKSFNNYHIPVNQKSVISEKYLDNDEYVEISISNKNLNGAKNLYSRGYTSKTTQNLGFNSKLSPLFESNVYLQDLSQQKTKRSSSLIHTVGIPLSHLNTQNKDPKDVPNKKQNPHQDFDISENDFSNIEANTSAKYRRSLTFPSANHSEDNLEFLSKIPSNIHEDQVNLRNQNSKDSKTLHIDGSRLNQSSNIIELRKTSKDIPSYYGTSNADILNLIMDPDHLETNASQNFSISRNKMRAKPRRPFANSYKSRRPLSMRFDAPKRGTIAAIRPISVLFSSVESDSDYELNDESGLSYLDSWKLGETITNLESTSESKKAIDFLLNTNSHLVLNHPSVKKRSSSFNSVVPLLSTDYINLFDVPNKTSRSLSLFPNVSIVEDIFDTNHPTPEKPTSIIIDNRLTLPLLGKNSRVSIPTSSKIDTPSGLSLLFKDKSDNKNPFQADYSKYYMAGNAAKKFVVFLPADLCIKTENMNLKSLTISVNNTISTEQTIGHVLYQYLEKAQSQSLLDEKLMSVVYWTMRLAEPDGEIDYDFPVLDRSQAISKFGSTDFALCLASQTEVESNKLAKEKSEQTSSNPGNLSQNNNFATNAPITKSAQKSNRLFTIGSIKFSESSDAYLRKSFSEKREGVITSPSKMDDLAMGKITNQEGIVRLVKVFFWHDTDSTFASDSNSNAQLINSTTVQIKVNQSVYDVLLILCKKFGYSARSYSLTDSKNPTQYLDPSTSIHSLGPMVDLCLLPIHLIKADFGNPIQQQNGMSFHRTFSVIRKMQLFSKYQQTLVIDEKFIAMIPVDQQRSDVSNTVTIPILNVTVKKSKHSKKFKLVDGGGTKKKTYDIEALSAAEANEILLLIERLRLFNSLDSS